MKPFNLEAALAGAKVQLRNGAQAYVLCDRRKYGIETDRPLLVETIGTGWVSSYTTDGSFGELEPSFDIVGMVTVKVTKYARIFNDGRVYGLFETKEEVDNWLPNWKPAPFIVAEVTYEE